MSGKNLLVNLIEGVLKNFSKSDIYNNRINVNFLNENKIYKDTLNNLKDKLIESDKLMVNIPNVHVAILDNIYWFINCQKIFFAELFTDEELKWHTPSSYIYVIRSFYYFLDLFKNSNSFNAYKNIIQNDKDIKEYLDFLNFFRSLFTHSRSNTTNKEGEGLLNRYIEWVKFGIDKGFIKYTTTLENADFYKNERDIDMRIDHLYFTSASLLEIQNDLGSRSFKMEYWVTKDPKSKIFAKEIAWFELVHLIKQMNFMNKIILEIIFKNIII